MSSKDPSQHCGDLLLSLRVDVLLGEINNFVLVVPGFQMSLPTSDSGPNPLSTTFGQKVMEAGLDQSMGSVGSACDNAMESFWGRMQVELLNRKRWKTRVDLANSIHAYIEIFHNTRCRHSSVNMLTPDEYERKHAITTAA